MPCRSCTTKNKIRKIKPRVQNCVLISLLISCNDCMLDWQPDSFRGWLVCSLSSIQAGWLVDCCLQKCMATYGRTRGPLWLHIVGSTFFHLQHTNSSNTSLFRQIDRRRSAQAISISKSQDEWVPITDPENYCHRSSTTLWQHSATPSQQITTLWQHSATPSQHSATPSQHSAIPSQHSAIPSKDCIHLKTQCNWQSNPLKKTTTVQAPHKTVQPPYNTVQPPQKTLYPLIKQWNHLIKQDSTIHNRVKPSDNTEQPSHNNVAGTIKNTRAGKKSL